jgi:hypothetical protein
MATAAAAEAERQQEETSELAHITAVNAQLQAALTTAEVLTSITSCFTHQKTVLTYSTAEIA